MDKEVYRINIDEKMQGTRIDVVLSVLFPERSRSYIQKQIESGGVTVNDAVCSEKKYKVSTGDAIVLVVPEPEEIKVEAENIPLEIVYEDECLLVVNKPQGMVVHPAPGNNTGTLVNAIMYHCGDRLSSINGVIRPGIVHRIDKDTSGLLMVAKSDDAHRSLAKQLAEHTITRIYQAIVYHNFAEDQGTIDAPIGRDMKNRLRQAVAGSNAKRAVTHYRVLERFGAFTRIEVRLETGRTHQIRVHMAYEKHPLLGDILYGPKKKTLGAERQMLHAKVLGFSHPRTGAYMEFDSPLPEDFSQVLEKLRK